ncbi:LD-carboxypeptidase [candidate division KSB1 bacterium]|nr:LD-carboxypeptidase [candidate division KSB1 bacterium]
MKRTKPEKLKIGDTIGIISPSSKPPDEAKFWRGIDYLKHKGFEVSLGKHVLNQRGYLAGSDDERAEDINSMFQRKDVRAIICSRGGYGGPRLLERLDYPAIKKHPRIFVGYSDITVLQNAILAKTGLITFSGPMVAVEMGAGITPFTEENFWSMLTTPQPVFPLANPAEKPFEVLREGTAEGRLVGGCLSVMLPLVGTQYFPDVSGGILVIEDIDEEAYRLDRALFHLRAAGVLNKVSAIVLGEFIDCEAKDPAKPSLTVKDVIHDALEGLNIPVISGFAYGHGKIKLTVPFGAQARLDTTKRTFDVIEPVVK